MSDQILNSPSPRPTSGSPQRRSWLAPGLAGQFLAFTVGFVLLAQVLIFPVSLASLREVWLATRAGAAELVALLKRDEPDWQGRGEFRAGLLAYQNILAVRGISNGHQTSVMEPDVTLSAPTLRVDLDNGPALFLVPAVLTNLFAPEGRLLVLRFRPELTTFDEMEVVMDEDALRAAFWESSGGIIANTFFTSALVGAFVYLVAFFLVVRPMQAIAVAISQFSASPEVSSINIPRGQSAETRRIAHALQIMQQAISSALRQKKRLADMGEAVAKICHDLRNSLSVVQVLSDGLSGSSDPKVQSGAPRLERAIERAITLAESTLRYGRAETPLPRLTPVQIKQAVTEAFAEALAAYPATGWSVDGDVTVTASADGDHLHRIITNLVRNSAKAAEYATTRSQPARVTASIGVDGNRIRLVIADNGPGVPASAIDTLFRPFAKGYSDGGSGLGLAIARELARGMGGDLELGASTPDGASFVLYLRRATAPA